MISIALGTAAFALFFLSDYTGFKYKFKSAGALFNCGGLSLIVSTAAAIPFNQFKPDFKNIIFLLLASANLALLLYSLFFALKKEAYTYASRNKIPLTDDGVYALCRHPGVIFLSLFYIFIYIIFNTEILLMCAVLFSALDILYVAWQDRFLFENTIENYTFYKQTTPFLVPTFKSVKKCLSDLKYKR